MQTQLSFVLQRTCYFNLHLVPYIELILNQTNLGGRVGRVLNPNNLQDTPLNENRTMLCSIYSMI